ncbi:MAG: nuclear transport factor 2 family protein [Candidatus Melainabacteria bacterium]|jgi:ketosteroid isomerase-like protein|nr:nuclear transport factor 2 family protein [Candidatus Melainabacteria bacterium]
MRNFNFAKFLSLFSFVLALVSLLLPSQAAFAAEEEKFKVSCVEPHSGCSESAKIIEELKDIVHALNTGNIDKAAEYYDEQVTSIDKKTKKLITGKKAVIDDLKKRMEAHNPNSQEPLKSITIDHPMAFVHGDTATVTFVAYKEYGGDRPYKMESHCTDIFVKRGDMWKKLHYVSNWKRVK